MEHIGAIFEGEWNFLNGMSSEEAEFMEQLLGNCSLPNEAQNNTNCPVSFWPSDENIAGVVESTMYSADGTSTSMYSFSQGSSYGSHFPSVSDHVFVGNNDLMAMDYCMEDKNDSIESNINMCEDVLQGTKTESKKRSREGGRNVKVHKVVREEDNNNKDDNAVVVHRQNSSSCSEDDSNASHVVTHSSSSKGKTRANRGSATDPQSLYARKRRERINERLRILQKLVPNGTKVDISTMLEEAVQYVKFLQLQIKLLSSDDMWMYAPIAYNGMDIGLDLKISTLRPQS